MAGNDEAHPLVISEEVAKLRPECELIPGVEGRPGEIVLLASSLWVEQGKDLTDCLLECLSGQSAYASRLAHTPVKALDLIRENRSFDAKPLRE